jgi:hypothetical protein
MKSGTRNTLILLIGLMSTISTLQAEAPKSAKEKSRHQPKCLEVYGTPTLNGKAEKGVLVKLYQGDKLIHLSAETRSNTVLFVLEQNTEYTLFFGKEGFPERSIRINTALPDSVDPEPIFRYDIKMELAIYDSDSPISDFPAGLIAFDPGTQKFEKSIIYIRGLNQLGRQAAVQQEELSASSCK